jgi:hypothetical protein
MRHQWTVSSRADGSRTVRTCTRCALIKISRHEWSGRHTEHWTEFYRGTDRINENLPHVPPCEPVEVDA